MEAATGDPFSVTFSPSVTAPGTTSNASAFTRNWPCLRAMVCVCFVVLRVCVNVPHPSAPVKAALKFSGVSRRLNAR